MLRAEQDMGREIRNFVAVVLTGCAVVLGIGLIGVTQDPPGGDRWGQWHVADEAATDALGIRRVESASGPEHCGWRQVQFLAIDPENIDPGGPFTYAQFVRDPERVLDSQYGLEPFVAQAKLPDDAFYTGWANGLQRLWIAADGSYAYIARGDLAEAWPKAADPIACL